MFSKRTKWSFLMKPSLFSLLWLFMFLASYLEGQLWTFRLLFKELYSCDSYVYSWFISSEILYEVLSHHCATLFHANIRVPQRHTVKNCPFSLWISLVFLLKDQLRVYLFMWTLAFICVSPMISISACFIYTILIQFPLCIFITLYIHYIAVICSCAFPALPELLDSMIPLFSAFS